MHSNVLKDKLLSKFLIYLNKFTACFCGIYTLFPRNERGSCVSEEGNHLKQSYNQVTGLLGILQLQTEVLVHYHSVLLCHDNEFKGWNFSVFIEKIIRLLYINDGLLAALIIS